MSAIVLLSDASVTGAEATVDRGGKYLFEVVGTFGADGNVRLERLGPDGETWYSLNDNASIGAAASVVVDLPPGKYRAAIEGEEAEGVYASLVRVD